LSFGPQVFFFLFKECFMSDASRHPNRRRFATQALALAGATSLGLPALAAKGGRPEKEQLKFGFIKLTDCAPLVVAYEKGYFEDEGLNVQLEAQANWKVLLDRVIDGQLDGAHMLAGQPLGATIGFGTKADIVTAFSMDLNGNGITVSNAVWAEMKPYLPMKDGKVVHPIKADALKKVVDAWKKEGKAFKMGMVFPVSTHNYELRYWLAAGGLNPGYYTASDTSGTAKADVLLSVTPPPQMPNTMEAGTIHGYCVGEPWNQQAVFKGIGVPVVTDNEIWKNNPEKVFGVTAAWAKANPNTHIAVVKALIRGTFEYEKGDKRPAPDFNIFFRNYATYPFYSDAIWYLTQMRRWGQITESKPDSWYMDVAKKVYQPGVYMEAANALVAEGKIKATDLPKTDGFKGVQTGFIDGVDYDGRKPNDYLAKFKIGLKASDKG
jgi:nitrate/nitrite transport system substrate-binding protein